MKGRQKHILGYLLAAWAALAFVPAAFGQSEVLGKKRPNLLLIISDDQSWIHTSAYNRQLPIQTPNFDQLAESGALMTHAYAPDGSCTPSRNAILTGRNIYELREGCMTNGFLDASFPTYVDLLEQSGYKCGFTGKGALPALHIMGGRTRDPAGQKVSEYTLPAPNEVSSTDYAANFDYFLKGKQTDQPFSFWIGINEPHVPYDHGIGERAGIDCSQIEVPGFLPDDATAREFLCDYLYEIAWYDQMLGRILKVLEAHGELDNTLIVVTSDNGIALPRAKMSLYEYGTRMPMAVRWDGVVAPGREITDFIPLKDLAPTFLEAAGVEVPAYMSAKSFLHVLQAPGSGRVDPERDHCYAAHERHAWFETNAGKPKRAIYTDDYIYIYNYPCCKDYQEDIFPESPWEDYSPDVSFPGETPLSSLIAFRNHPSVRPYWEMSFGEKAEHELYLRDGSDPYQLRNVADDPAYASLRDSLHRKLMAYSEATGDPRYFGTSQVRTYEQYNGSWLDNNRELVEQNQRVLATQGGMTFAVARPGKGPSQLGLGPDLCLRPGLYCGEASWMLPDTAYDITRYSFRELRSDGEKGEPLFEVWAGNGAIRTPEVAMQLGATQEMAVFSANRRGEGDEGASASYRDIALQMPHCIDIFRSAIGASAAFDFDLENLGDPLQIDEIRYPDWMSGPAGPGMLEKGGKYPVAVTFDMPDASVSEAHIYVRVGEALDSISVRLRDPGAGPSAQGTWLLPSWFDAGQRTFSVDLGSWPDASVRAGAILIGLDGRQRAAIRLEKAATQCKFSGTLPEAIAPGVYLLQVSTSDGYHFVHRIFIKA